MSTPEDAVPPPLARAAPARLSARDFEHLAADLFNQDAPTVSQRKVVLRDRVKGVDGTYEFDATVRFRWGGMDFLVVIEAKRHSHPIKRETVQVLHDKARSVGAHKAVLVSTAPFQKGALEYAEVHGIALVHVADERKFVMRDMPLAIPGRLDTRDDIHEPVARVWSLDPDGSLRSVLVSDEPEYAAALLLGLPDT